MDWTKCIAMHSDGAKAIIGKNSGLVVKLKDLMPKTEWTHCFLHRHKKNAGQFEKYFL